MRFGFRNGSYVAGTNFNFTYYPLFGSSSLDTDLDEFVSKLEVRRAALPVQMAA